MCSNAIQFLITQLTYGAAPDRDARRTARKNYRDLTNLLDTERFQQVRGDG